MGLGHERQNCYMLNVHVICSWRFMFVIKKIILPKEVLGPGMLFLCVACTCGVCIFSWP